jgi:hypothetical protein
MAGKMEGTRGRFWSSGRTIGADFLKWSSDERSINGDDVEQIK